MAMPGETILLGAPHLPDVSPFKVMRSNAGYYVGTSQNGCPYTRESGYFRTENEAESALITYETTGILPHAR
jgi:hypothetical protein